MARYYFEAVDAQGRRFTDVQEAPDREALLAALEARGVHVVRWREAPGSGLLRWGRRRRLSSREQLDFIAEMGQLLRSGVPVDRALKIVADASASQGVRNLALQVREGVRRGRTLSDALAEYGPEFGDLAFSMIRVGEVGGVLDTVLEKLASYMARSEEIRRFVLSSSTYPLVLLVVGAASVAAILGFVIPRFAVILNDLGGSIPTATRMLIAASDLFRKAWWVGPVACAAALAAAIHYRKRPEVRQRILRALMRLPVVGSLMVDVEVSRFARTLGTLLLSGVPMLKSLAVARAVIRNEVIREGVMHIYQHVQQGKSLSVLLKQFSFFPPIIVHMAAIGEETGRLGEMLLTVAETLEEDLQTRTRSYLSLLEPAVIVFMGVLIGGMVVSMLLAIFGIHDVTF